MAKSDTNPTKVESIHHQDRRANIPTEELRDFVAGDEQAPKTLLYPRDPSLDPQLVWRGKDEQEAQDLAVPSVPSVPIYIQEKIHPQAIINDLLTQQKHTLGGRGLPDQALPRLQRRPGRIRPEGGVLPARAELDQPHDPG